MGVQVNIGEAKTRLSELLARVDAGEEVIIARGNTPLYEIRRLEPDRSAAREAVERLIKRRKTHKPIAVEEILAWRDEGRR